MSSASFVTSFRRLHVVALVTLLLVALNSQWLDMFHTQDNRLSDYFVRQFAQKLSPDPDIVIVDIDEASLAATQDAAESTMGKGKSI
jgi:adenylate cyclase